MICWTVLNSKTTKEMLCQSAITLIEMGGAKELSVNDFTMFRHTLYSVHIMHGCPVLQIMFVI